MVIQRPTAGFLAYVVKVGRFPEAAQPETQRVADLRPAASVRLIQAPSPAALRPQPIEA